MDLSVRCPSCGGRTTVESRDIESPGFVLCPYCRQEIPLKHGGETEPPEPADGAT